MKSSESPIQELSGFRHVCPECRAALEQRAGAYVCLGCGRDYPIIFGIPDFRIASDQYLSLEAERDKAGDLAGKASHLSFRELLDYYYSITDDVPSSLSHAYTRAILNGPDHLEPIARDIDSGAKGTVLDAGCGAGSLLIALAKRHRKAVGVDIALRWLVLCRKRLMEAGIEQYLVCADITRPPFEDHSAGAIAGIDLIEHTHDMQLTVRCMASLLQPGGAMWLAVSNRYALGPHPPTRLWFIGFLPRRAAARLSLASRGVNSIRHLHLTTPTRIAAMLGRSGLRVTAIRPRRIARRAGMPHTGLEGILVRLYQRLTRWPLLDRLLVRVGPAAEITAELPSRGGNDRKEAA